MRHGYEAILRTRHDMAPVGSASGRLELWPLAYRADPRAILVGEPEGEDQLALCLHIAGKLPRARLVIAAEDPDGTSERDIASTVGLHRGQLPGRYARIVAALRGCGADPVARVPAFYAAGL